MKCQFDLAQPCNSEAIWENQHGKKFCDYHKLLLRAFNWELRDKIEYKSVSEADGRQADRGSALSEFESHQTLQESDAEQAKVWRSILILEDLRCYCGAKIKILEVKKLDERFLLLKVNEFKEFPTENPVYALYDIIKKVILPPGTFPLEQKDLVDWIISKWKMGAVITDL